MEEASPEARLELAMARTALEHELSRNRELVDQCFNSKHSQSTETDSTCSVASAAESHETEPESLHLWCKAPEATNYRPKSAAVVVNPSCAGALQHLETACAELRRLGIEPTPLISEHVGHERELTERAQADIVCIIGGNGTVRECINGLMRRPDRDSIAIALLGGGLASIERTLGIQSLEDGLKRLRIGSVRRMDIIALGDSAGKTTFGLSCGFGSYASQLPQGGSALKSVARQLGTMIRHRNHSARLQIPEDEVPRGLRSQLANDNEYAGIGVCTGQHLGSYSAPLAKLDDGLMDVIITRKVGRSDLVDHLGRVPENNRLEEGPRAYIQVSSLKLELAEARSFRKDPVSVDGDIIGEAPFSLRIVPQTLRIFA